MNARRRVSVFVNLLIASSLLLMFTAAEGQELKKIKIGYPAIAYNQLAVWVAKDAGLFRRYGLDAELVFFRGGQMAVQALVSGDPPIVNIGNVVQAGLQGHDVVLIAASETAYAFSVAALAGIARVENLRGKKLGVSGFGSLSHNAALLFLRRFNFEPNKDVTIVVAGTATERVAAMAAGAIDATLLTPSELVMARKRGYREIYDLLDMGIEVQGNGFATSRSFIRSQRATVKAALTGYVEAVHYIHAHKDGTNRILAQYLRNPDPEVLDASYRAFVKMVPKKPYPTLKGIQLLLDELAAEMPQAKSARPEQFVDLSLLQELEKEGFFAEMGQKYP
jgi:NitT/TauT family transport system substrate-binding protein